MKSIHRLEQKIGTVEKGKEYAKEEIIQTQESIDVRVKDAVTVANSEEHTYFPGMLAKENVKIASLKLKVDSSKSFQTSLIDAKVSSIFTNQNCVSV